MSTLKVDTILKRTGTGTITVGQSGDTVALPAATLTTPLPAASGGTGSTTAPANTPAFNVKLSSNQDVSDAVSTVVAFNSEQLDTDNAFDTSTYRFTPQTAGKYFITFTAYCLAANAGNGNLRSITAHIRKNGSNQTEVVHDYNDSFIRQGCVTTTGIIDMNGSTDYIDFEGDVNTGSGDGRFQNNTRANGFLLVGA